MLYDEIKEVNARKKKLDGMITIMVFLLVIWIAVLYFGFLRSILAGTWFGAMVGSIKHELATFSALCSLYVTLLGGLFFIFIPMEAYYLNALNHTQPVALYAMFILGISISYTLDYFVGMKFSRLSRKLISPKQFYKIKSLINRRGQAAIFAANAIPMLPSPQVTFVLGVFRYNRMRLFILTASANMLKYSYLLAIWSLF
jgi:hypothetical protein